MAELSSFAIQTNEDCNRACDHCMDEANINGPSAEFSDLENALNEISKIVNDGFASKRIDLLGESLRYQNKDKTLNDVLELIEDHNLNFSLITRGFTNNEKEKSMLIYQNFKELVNHLTPENTAQVSFDTYTFGGNGDSQIGYEMANNALTGILEKTDKVNIHSITSVERLKRTYEAVNNLMDQLGFTIDTTNINQGESIESYVAIQYATNSEATITFKKENKTIKTTFFGVLNAGRAEKLDEIPPNPNATCQYRNIPSDYSINVDQTVVPCSGASSKVMPNIGSLKETGIWAILCNNDAFYQAVDEMEKDHSEYLAENKIDICSVCPNLLPEYLEKQGIYQEKQLEMIK